MIGILLGPIVGCNGNYFRCVSGKKDRDRVLHPIADWQTSVQSVFVFGVILQSQMASVVDGCDQGEQHYDGAKLRVKIYSGSTSSIWATTWWHPVVMMRVTTNTPEFEM
jgi:hypothetical protein